MERMEVAVSSPNACITAAMRAASRRLTALYDEIMAPSGLRVTQYTLLAELKRQEDDPPTVTELSSLLIIERSALGQALRPLERCGFLKLARDKSDGRCRVILLTTKGRAALARARPYWEECHDRFLRFFGAAAARDLLVSLQGIAANAALVEEI